MLGEPSFAFKFRDKIQEALNHAGNVMTIEDLYAFVLSGDMLLWTDENKSAIIFTEVVYYPRVMAVRGVVSAGCIDGIKSMIPKIAEWGLAHGCTRAEVIGRKGWQRVFGIRWGTGAEVVFAKCEDII